MVITDSSPSAVSTITSPDGIVTCSSTGCGVWKRCSGMSVLHVRNTHAVRKDGHLRCALGHAAAPRPGVGRRFANTRRVVVDPAVLRGGRQCEEHAGSF